MDNALESVPTVGRPAVIDRKDHITPQGHIDIPTSGAVQPIARHQLGMRPTIDVNDRRVFLGGIQIGR